MGNNANLARPDNVTTFPTISSQKPIPVKTTVSSLKWTKRDMFPFPMARYSGREGTFLVFPEHREMIFPEFST